MLSLRVFIYQWWLTACCCVDLVDGDGGSGQGLGKKLRSSSLERAGTCASYSADDGGSVTGTAGLEEPARRLAPQQPHAHPPVAHPPQPLPGAEATPAAAPDPWQPPQPEAAVPASGACATAGSQRRKVAILRRNSPDAAAQGFGGPQQPVGCERSAAPLCRGKRTDVEGAFRPLPYGSSP